MLGEDVTVLKLYNEASEEDPQNHPPVNTLKGFFTLTKFYKELAIEVFALPEVVSELGEIKAQSDLLDTRRDLALKKIKGKSELAVARIAARGTQAAELLIHKEDLKNAAESMGEIRAAFVKGWLRTTFGVLPDFAAIIATIPVSGFRGFLDAAGDWLEENPEIAKPGMGGSALAVGVTGYYFFTDAMLKEWLFSNPVNFVMGMGVIAASSAPGAFGGVSLYHIGKPVLGALTDKVGEYKDGIGDWVSEHVVMPLGKLGKDNSVSAQPQKFVQESHRSHFPAGRHNEVRGGKNVFKKLKGLFGGRKKHVFFDAETKERNFKSGLDSLRQATIYSARASARAEELRRLARKSHEGDDNGEESGS